MSRVPSFLSPFLPRLLSLLLPLSSSRHMYVFNRFVLVYRCRYTRRYLHMYMYLCVLAHVDVHVLVQVLHVYLYMYVGKYRRTHVHVHAYMHTVIHTHMYAYARSVVLQSYSRARCTRTARTMSALAAPCLPLLVLALCFLVEAAARGRGSVPVCLKGGSGNEVSRSWKQ